MSIKKGANAASVVAPVSVQEAPMMDLLDSGDSDFMSAPAAPVANFNMFDAFSAPTPAAHQGMQDDFGFASFTAAPAPVQQQHTVAFDPFGMGSTPTQPQTQPQVMSFSQSPSQFQQQAPMMPQQSFGQFNSPIQAAPVIPSAPTLNNQFGMMQSSMQPPMAPQQSMGQFYSPPIPSPSMQQPVMQNSQYQQPQQQQPMGSYAAPKEPIQQQQQVFRGIVKAPEPDYGDFESSGPSGTSGSAPITQVWTILSWT